MTDPPTVPPTDGTHTTGLFDGAETLEAAVGQAVGLASVCWSPGTGDAVFDTDAASNVVSELLDWIARHPPHVPDEALRLALSDPGAYVPWVLSGVEDYEPLTTWQLRAVRAVLAGQPPHPDHQPPTEGT